VAAGEGEARAVENHIDYDAGNDVNRPWESGPAPVKFAPVPEFPIAAMSFRAYLVFCVALRRTLGRLLVTVLGRVAPAVMVVVVQGE
jgi:hypothetical protein